MNDPRGGDGAPVALILAAGRGSRLLPHTEATPKCLLDVGGESILGFQLRHFLAAGLCEVIVVSGFRADLVEETCADSPRVVCLENVEFATTNSLHSLSLAVDRVAGRPLVLVNGDVLFHPRVLQLLLEHPAPCALTIDTGSSLGEEEMKVRVQDGQVAEISKALPASRASGESLGLLKFDSVGAGVLFEESARLVEGGEGGNWAPRAYNEVLRTCPIAVVETGGLPWIEMDTPEDLERARTDVYARCVQHAPR